MCYPGCGGPCGVAAARFIVCSTARLARRSADPRRWTGRKWMRERPDIKELLLIAALLVSTAVFVVSGFMALL